MRWGLIEVVIFDALVLLFAYEVELDVAWRNAYANDKIGTASTSYGFLTRALQIVRPDGQVLRSPPTLDWVQVSLALLIIVNLVVIYEQLRPGEEERKSQV